MFQQTIHDVLKVSEAGPRPEDLLERMAATIGAFEAFECGEIVARTERGVVRFSIAPGLGEIGPRCLELLGEEPTLRIDTAADMTARGLFTTPALASVLILRIDAPLASPAAIVLGHSRAWSFAAAPLSRIRAIAALALRILIRSEGPKTATGETRRNDEETALLRTRVAVLEKEIVGLRATLAAARKDSDRPR